MTVGQFVETKFTWLLDEVEIRGIVNSLDDEIDIVPDPNYRHLIGSLRGNQPLPWQPLGSPGVLHCESYPIGANVYPGARGSIDRNVPWPLAQLPGGQELVGKDYTGAVRPLQIGDHVRLVGRWCIDHHPEFCDDCVTFVPSEPMRCRNRGLLRVGQVHAELHPYRWDQIEFVDTPFNRGEKITLSLAAPIHEEQYLAGGKWLANEIAGVASKIFIDDDGGNFHSTVSADIAIDGPIVTDAQMQALGAQARTLRWIEIVRVNGTGQLSDLVRRITASPHRIRVQASVTAPGGLEADIHLPANGLSVFQAEYTVWWEFTGSKISCIKRSDAGDADRRIHAVGGKLNDGTDWRLSLDDAIGMIDAGGSFYVESDLGTKIAIDVAVSRSGRRFLKTAADAYLPDNLLALPECVDVILT